MAINPASIRNLNPGAMYPGPSAKKFGAIGQETLKSKDGTHLIATFPTAIHGAAALFDLLANGKRAGLYLYRGKTIEKAVQTWCGGYYAATYLKILKDKGGVDTSEILSLEFLHDGARAIPLAKAMAWQEAGRDFPLSDEDWAVAHNMAFEGNAIAPSWSPRNDVPSPRPENRMATVLGNIKTGLGIASAGGAATVSAPYVPSVPDHVNQTVLNLQAWKSLAMQATAMGSEAWVSIGAGGGAAWGAFVVARKVLGV